MDSGWAGDGQHYSGGDGREEGGTGDAKVDGGTYALVWRRRAR